MAKRLMPDARRSFARCTKGNRNAFGHGHHTTEAIADDGTSRALGAGPLGHDEAHSRRVADLTVYLRQHHAERDFADLGAQVARHGTTW